MPDSPLIFDVHLDLSMNALEWNRDQRWTLERIRRWEVYMKDKVDRGNNTVCFPEMRMGRVGLCVATQIGRFSPYFHRLAGWSSPEQAWATTQGQLAWYREMEAQGEMVQIRTKEQLEKHLVEWLHASNVDDGANYSANSRGEPAGPKLPIGDIMSVEGADANVTLKDLEGR